MFDHETWDFLILILLIYFFFAYIISEFVLFFRSEHKISEILAKFGRQKKKINSVHISIHLSIAPLNSHFVSHDMSLNKRRIYERFLEKLKFGTIQDREQKTPP